MFNKKLKMSFLIVKQDIIKIQLINQDYLKFLNPILDDTISVKGCSAFWTLKYNTSQQGAFNRYCSKLYKLLQGKDSFMAVDLHLPTNIEEICNAVNAGCNFYMFMLEGKGGIYSEIHNKLLHTKLILFEGQEHDYVLIGSHNQTLHAINENFNFEASILIQIDPTSQTKHNITQYLEYLKNLSKKLPQGNLEKWMLKLVQEKGKLEGLKNMNFIECIVANERSFESIKQGSLIHLISFLGTKDDKELSKINVEFCLSIQTKTGERKFFIVNVDKSSKVDEKIKKQSTGQTFAKRLYLYTGLTKDYAKVTPTVIFPQKELDLGNNFYRENKFNLELKVVKEISTIKKASNFPTTVDVWDTENKNIELYNRLYNQIDATTSEFDKSELYKSIRIIDLVLLEKIFGSENKEFFLKEQEKIILDNLGEEIPIYNVSDDYLKIFKHFDKFISTNNSGKRKNIGEIIRLEFEKYYQEFEKNGGKITVLESKRKLNKNHALLNKGVALIN
ncbi:MAG: hypothetical protein FJX80_06330 [Bacteroidetes bacterium]|nr:hypothetical protein [Bacteroidota bacterium]